MWTMKNLTSAEQSRKEALWVTLPNLQ